MFQDVSVWIGNIASEFKAIFIKTSCEFFWPVCTRDIHRTACLYILGKAALPLWAFLKVSSSLFPVIYDWAVQINLTGFGYIPPMKCSLTSHYKAESIYQQDQNECQDFNAGIYILRPVCHISETLSRLIYV